MEHRLRKDALLERPCSGRNHSFGTFELDVRHFYLSANEEFLWLYARSVTIAAEESSDSKNTQNPRMKHTLVGARAGQSRDCKRGTTVDVCHAFCFLLPVIWIILHDGECINAKIPETGLPGNGDRITKRPW